MSKEVCIDKDVAYHQTVIGAAKTVLIPSAQNGENVNESANLQNDVPSETAIPMASSSSSAQ